MKSYCLTALALFVTLLANSQTPYKGQNPFRIETRFKHEIGARAGVNLPWFHGDDKRYTGVEYSKACLIAGIYDKYSLNKSFDIQAELLYLSGGAQNPQENRQFITHYLSLPIILAYKTGDFNFQAGGYFSKLIMAKSYDFFDKDVTFNWEVWKWDYYQTIDFGLIAGMGYNLHGGRIETHYRYGLNQVRRKSYNDSKLVNCKTTSLDISLYVPFNRDN